MSKIQQQNPDGTWSDAAPLPMTPGIDFEVSGDTWLMYDGSWLVGSGVNRTRLGRAVAMWRAKSAYLRAQR